MEDESRQLPKGWVRTYDPESHHQFFVDTTKDPPRSVWHHPYDDEEYLSTLSSEDRERIEQESLGRGHPLSKADIIAHHTDDEDEDDHDHHSTPSVNAELPPRAAAGDKGKGKQTFGRKLKDKVTGTTHEERGRERARRAEEERQTYEQHMRFRQAMSKAAQTGQPQLVGKDRQGKDVYVDPPGPSGLYGGGLTGGGLGMYGGGGYGYNPYGNTGMYAPPGAYGRPTGAYRRPYGGGFGGGYGMPLALGGGLMGGLLLGDMMGGGMGGGMF